MLFIKTEGFVFLPRSDSGEVFTWGKGKCGRLGHGDNRDRYVKRS